MSITMNLTQERLKKHEWEAIEVPVSPEDKIILKLSPIISKMVGKLYAVWKSM